MRALEHSLLRKEMVDRQIAARGIDAAAVLDAMRTVPRHEFVPSELSDSAYADRPLPIGSDQTISQPYMVALMSAALGPSPHDKVLEIGTGSGYQTAVLLHMGCAVFSVERIPEIAARARETLSRLGYGGYSIRVADGTLGWQEEAPYNGIIVTAASPRVPHRMLEQLGEGGRLVIPIGNAYSQMLTMITKSGSRYTTREICECVFVPLIGEEGWEH